MSRESEVLRWLVKLLDDARSPYQIVGGLAARAYGASRALVDIDVYVPSESLERVVESAQPHVRSGPIRHRDEHWDLTFAKLEYGGVPIEVAAADDAKLFDRRTATWVSAGVDFARGNEMEVAGVRLRVMPLEQLIEYKCALGRDVDAQDVAELQNAVGDPSDD